MSSRILFQTAYAVRFRALLPRFISVLEKHGHLSLNPALREQLMKDSASFIYSLLKEAHINVGKKRNGGVNHVSKIPGQDVHLA